jgi:ATP-dependent helicase/nuclease subunit A
MLLNRSLERDSISTARYNSEKTEEQREAANLLYVALTRARNMLVISGCRPSKRSSKPSWYEQMTRALCDEKTAISGLIKTHGTPGPLPESTSGPAGDLSIDPRLGQTISVRPAWFEIAPSKSADSDNIESGDADGILRGLVIHRLLQLSVGENPPEPDATILLRKVADEFCMRQSDNRLLEWWQEVSAVIDNTSLDWLTRPDADHRAFNEVPIAYRRHNQTVYGVIDRIVAGPEHVTVVDYKTHRLDDTSVEQLVSHYAPQLELYREGVQRLWPDHSTRACLLLTHECCLVDMP